MDIEIAPDPVPATTPDIAHADPLDFDTCFRDWFASVARTAALVSRDPVAGPDLAQEAFTRVLPRWAGLGSEDHARNLIFRTAINLARSHARRARLASAATLHLIDRRTETEGGVGATTDWLDIANALGTVSVRQRECVVLADYVDMDAAAIGRMLGMGEGTVRVHLMRGRRALRARLSLPDRPEQEDLR